MAPNTPGGRPKIPWDASRKRKLVRLYLMTDLKITDIQQVLSTNGFTPGSRNIQTQLSALLPDNVKEWRRYRPNGIEKGKDRLLALKSCREQQKSKCARLSSRSRVTPQTTNICTVGLKQLQVTNPFYDPSRYYCDADCNGVLSYSFFPTTSQPYFGQSSSSISPQLAIQTSASDSDSEKEVVCAAFSNTSNERSKPSQECDGGNDSQEPAQAAPGTLGNLATSNSASFPAVSLMELQQDETGALAVSDETRADFSPPAITRSNSRVSRNGGASIRTMSTRISSRASISWSHVSSVLAATLSSGFSQRWSAGSSPASLSGLENPYTPWSRAEFDSWNELVDESRLEQTSSQLPSLHAGSLYQRPCCSLFEAPPYSRTMGACNTCGYNGMFHLARHKQIHLFDRGAQDRFGNTALHHAMAAGNLEGVKVWLSSAAHSSNVDLSHRNTSGETFLHVCRLRKPRDFITYVEILKAAVKRGFDFNTRDFSGRTIAQRFHELTNEWDIILDHLQILEACAILGLKGNSDLNGLQYNDLAPPHLLPAFPPVDCDTPLLKRLRQSLSTPIRDPELQSLVRKSDIHMRDKRGYTALANAARLGLRDTIHYLLENGANPNTRSYQGTSVIAHATAHLAQAQHKGDNELYSRILSCIVHLTDHGAKPIVDDYDEFCIEDAVVVKNHKTTKIFRSPYTQTPAVVQRKASIRDRLLKPLLKSTSTIKPKRKRKLVTIEEDEEIVEWREKWLDSYRDRKPASIWSIDIQTPNDNNYQDLALHNHELSVPELIGTPVYELDARDMPFELEDTSSRAILTKLHTSHAELEGSSQRCGLLPISKLGAASYIFNDPRLPGSYNAVWGTSQTQVQRSQCNNIVNSYLPLAANVSEFMSHKKHVPSTSNEISVQTPSSYWVAHWNAARTSSIPGEMQSVTASGGPSQQGRCIKSQDVSQARSPCTTLVPPGRKTSETPNAKQIIAGDHFVADHTSFGQFSLDQDMAARASTLPDWSDTLDIEQFDPYEAVTSRPTLFSGVEAAISTVPSRWPSLPKSNMFEHEVANPPRKRRRKNKFTERAGRSRTKSSVITISHDHDAPAPPIREGSPNKPRKRRCRAEGVPPQLLPSSNFSSSFQESSEHNAGAQVFTNGSLTLGLSIPSLPLVSCNYANKPNVRPNDGSDFQLPRVDDPGQFEFDLFTNPWADTSSDMELTDLTPDPDLDETYSSPQYTSITSSYFASMSQRTLMAAGLLSIQTEGFPSFGSFTDSDSDDIAIDPPVAPEVSREVLKPPEFPDQFLTPPSDTNSLPSNASLILLAQGILPWPDISVSTTIIENMYDAED